MFVTITALFALAMAAIIWEHQLGFDKAKSCLFLGTAAWLLLYVAMPDKTALHHMFEENVLEVSMLWMFLISAMTFIAYLNERGFIETAVSKVLPSRITEKRFLFALGTFIFFFSSVADNLTATLVGMSVLLSLPIKKEKLIPFGVGIVFAANAGGVALITGDVTTLMIFEAKKIEMGPTAWLFIPSFISTMLLFATLASNLKGSLVIEKTHGKLARVDGIIAAAFLSTIAAVIVGHVFFHVPPMLTFLFGLSVMFAIGWAHKKRRGEDLELLHYVRKIEFEVLFFFLGILFLVGALKEVGALSYVSDVYGQMPVQYASYLIGWLSALVDNIPLTAILLKSEIPGMQQADWLALTYSVGAGGSLLVAGSAAGVVAMDKIKGLTFGAYLKYLPHLAVAYSVGYVATYATARLVT
ncbi:MAG: sodium:proton antiporter NhaD [Patescibacteria group bacterium]